MEENKENVLYCSHCGAIIPTLRRGGSYYLFLQLYLNWSVSRHYSVNARVSLLPSQKGSIRADSLSLSTG